jgi:hypothetical protein
MNRPTMMAGILITFLMAYPVRSYEKTFSNCTDIGNGEYCHGSRTNNLPSVHKAQVGRSYDM